ncbi:unnamed protein product [Blepharisma stoltei]|uniref:Cytochrome c oxidase assembly protein COX19 n=1 Tax=Blepharisma stoltei TaxID=1481888 RepID=A0AAU9JL79_9CILI|nr:unnamed protein product [Blepharisma stoltei]
MNNQESQSIVNGPKIDIVKGCEIQAERYRACLSRPSKIPKKCKIQAKEYMQCRMEKEILEDLGEDGYSWEQDKIPYRNMTSDLIRERINQITKESEERVRQSYNQPKNN